jgi:hypothetical protein
MRLHLIELGKVRQRKLAACVEARPPERMCAAQVSDETTSVLDPSGAEHALVSAGGGAHRLNAT